MEKSRIHLIIKGMVQGVCFRANVKSKAKSINLNGSVENKSDGTVQIYAEGNKEDLQNLIEFCKNSPDFANVDKISIEWQKFLNEFDSFEIIY